MCKGSSEFYVKWLRVFTDAIDLIHGSLEERTKNQAVYPARGGPLKRTRVASEELLQSWSHILKFPYYPGRNILEAIWWFCCIPAKNLLM